MSENEPGQLGNREIITVCIAVSLAVIMVASLMPAMIPQGGDDGPSLYVTSITIEDNGQPHETKIQTVNFYHESTLLGKVTIPIPWNNSYVGSNGNLALYGYDYDGANGNWGDVTADRTLTFDGHFTGRTTFVGFEEFQDYPYMIGEKTGTDEYPIFSTGEVVGPEGTPSIKVLLWEAFFLNTGYDLGFDPEYPPGSSAGGSDSTTAIVMAIIAIIFLGIALTALRTVLPGRGGQR